MSSRTVLLVSFLCLAPLGTRQSQETSMPEHVISRILDRGLLDGHDTKVVGGIGDAAAVIGTKVVGGRSLSPAQIDLVLIVLNMVLNMAFADVTPGPEKQPRTTLFVLRQLELSTNDAQLRARIAQTRKYVGEEFSKSTKPLPQI